MPRNVAIAIGVNHYQYERNLEFASNDAKAMKVYLESIGFDEVWLYSDTSAEQSRQPELTQLRRVIRRIGNNLQLSKEDSFWFFFSGHGGRQGGMDYLLPSNGDPEDLAFSGIAIDDVTRSLRACRAGNLVMILDACRNVIPTEKSSTIDLVQRQKGIITLFSCEPGQKSYELTDLRQGAFTYSLLRALQGTYNPNRCNVLQLSEYLRQTVPTLVEEKLKAQQSPYFIAEPVEKAMQMLLPLPQKVEPIPEPDIPEDTNQSPSGKSAGSHVGALMREAFRATQRQEWEEAKQLWEQVLFEAHDPEDRKLALEQRDYVSSQQSASVEEKQKKLERELQEQADAERKRLEVIREREQRKQEEVNRRAKNEQPKSFVEDLGNGVKLEMILIPKGSFLMGSTDEEVARLVKEFNEDRFNREKPQHRVEITQEFYMGKYAVTQAQYEAVMGTNPSKFKKGGLFPVEQVIWDDAQAFCKKLSKRSSRNYRLPSEAEWEYACRAGTDTRYHFGNKLTKQQANFSYESIGGIAISLAKWATLGLAGTKKVDQYPPNDFGLYDMHGNVWEWCEDSWEDNYKVSRSQKPFVNSSDRKVIRGGSWLNSPWFCRSAYRFDFDRGYRDLLIGFRVACSPQGLP